MSNSVARRGAALGAIGLLAFAIVFSLMAKASIAAAFIGTSFAWLVISVAASYVRRKKRSVRRVQTEQEGRGSAIRRSHRGYVKAYHVAIEAFALRLPLTWLR